jgi:hypothetical protein
VVCQRAARRPPSTGFVNVEEGLGGDQLCGVVDKQVDGTLGRLCCRSREFLDGGGSLGEIGGDELGMPSGCRDGVDDRGALGLVAARDHDGGPLMGEGFRDGPVDRDSILTCAAVRREQPWKYYDLGDGFCSWDFFAECFRRMACARCPCSVPKEPAKGRLLAVKEGISTMLEQLDLTDDEREALEGERAPVTALAQRPADIPMPAGPTLRELGNQQRLRSAHFAHGHRPRTRHEREE